MSTKTRWFFGIAALGALLGMIYSGFSTTDFISHLDRQLHPVNCSLLPGLSETSQIGKEAQGCTVAMFSPYSSFWRDKYWGGVPISLFGLGLFGFALALAVWCVLSGRGHKLLPSLFLLFSGLVAVGTSLVLFVISLTELHALCTLCVGTYFGSGILLLGALLAFFAARADRAAADSNLSTVLRQARRRGARSPWSEPSLDGGAGEEAWEAGAAVLETAAEEKLQAPAKGAAPLAFLLLAVEMGLAVFLPAEIYLATLPDYRGKVTGCETLKAPADKDSVLLPLRRTSGGAPAAAAGSGGTEALLVLDPLCQACKAFHRRMESTPLASGLSYEALLLPLDTECNWMLQDSLHPGACMLSRALICAGSEAGTMLGYFYEQEAALTADSKAGRLDAMKQKVLARYPGIASCIDAPETKIKLNKTLHYAVRNALPVLTPQLYLNGKRLCDEDTDLGLEYSLVQLLAKKE